MVKTDEDALICDLAETYGIYDYKRLPLTMVAAFSVGLRDNSRIKMKLAGTRVSSEIMLMASIVDRLSLLLWSQTKDGSKGRNRPTLILESLIGKTDQVLSFRSGEGFEKAREKLLKEMGMNGD